MEKQGKTACKRPVDSSKASFLAFSAAAILDGTSKSVTVQWPGQDLHLGAFKMAVSGPLSAVRALAEARAAAKHLCNEQSLGKAQGELNMTPPWPVAAQTCKPLSLCRPCGTAPGARYGSLEPIEALKSRPTASLKGHATAKTQTSTPTRPL